MLGQGEFAARRTQTIDHFDGHDVRGPDRMASLGHMTGHDLVQTQLPPQPASQPDIPKAAAIGPTHRVQANPRHLGIIRQRYALVVREQA
jgi:hypothetical protein